MPATRGSKRGARLLLAALGLALGLAPAAHAGPTLVPLGSFALQSGPIGEGFGLAVAPRSGLEAHLLGRRLRWTPRLSLGYRTLATGTRPSAGPELALGLDLQLRLGESLSLVIESAWIGRHEGRGAAAAAAVEAAFTYRF